MLALRRLPIKPRATLLQLSVAATHKRHYIMDTLTSIWTVTIPLSSLTGSTVMAYCGQHGRPLMSDRIYYACEGAVVGFAGGFVGGIVAPVVAPVLAVAMPADYIGKQIKKRMK